MTPDRLAAHFARIADAPNASSNIKNSFIRFLAEHCHVALIAR